MCLSSVYPRTCVCGTALLIPEDHTYRVFARVSKLGRQLSILLHVALWLDVATNACVGKLVSGEQVA